jgi:hypothetical protein
MLPLLDLYAGGKLRSVTHWGTLALLIDMTVAGHGDKKIIIFKWRWSRKNKFWRYKTKVGKGQSRTDVEGDSRWDPQLTIREAEVLCLR